MTLVLTILASLLPTALLMWFFYRSDLFPEPPRMLFRTFGLGVLATIPAVALESLASSVFAPLGNPARSLLEAFVTAALVEESLKLLVLRGYSFRKASFDEPMDGIQYGVASALGFATLENVLYVVEGGLGVAVMRGLLSVPGHASWGAMLGFFAGRGVLSGRKARWSLAGLALAVLFHGLYDFPVMLAFQGDKAYSSPGTQALMFLLLLAVSVAGWVIVARTVARTRRRQKDRVPSGETPAAEPVTRTLYRGSMRGSPVGSWVLVIIGALVGIGGGLMTAGLLIAFATGQVDDPASTAIGGVIAGILPLAAGILMYTLGMRGVRRNRAPTPQLPETASI
ncbi:MAG TPA: PrsW family glutamic-type intramembrane protease [Candidatus Fermentibacter sp.]|nr:PrsW family glutamic-type intramembrane protease [Candidatus Fermentibacter sp.]